MADQSADVRVKLSAEGVAEVVAAFQKISSEAKKSGKDASGAFADLGKQFDEIGKKLTGLLAIGLVAEKFAEFFKTTLEGAEAMETLSRQTGLTTDTIQAFGRAARNAGVDQQAINEALARFSTAVGRAEIGTRQSASALGDLGISAKQLADASPDQKLLLVAQGLSKIEDPARRARDEVALFGRQSQDLDQVLVAVGEQGLAPFIVQLQRLGLYMSPDTLGNFEAATKSFRNMADEVKGLAMQFTTGLAPGLADASDKLTQFTNRDGVSGFQKLGELVGGFLRLVVSGLAIAGDDIAAFVAEAQIRFSSYASAAANAVRGNWTQAVEDIRQANDQIKAIEDQRLADNTKVTSDFLDGPPKPGDQPKGKTGGGNQLSPEQQAALARARLQVTEATLDSELTLYKAHAALLEETDKASYDAGTLALTDYYERRAQIINDEVAKEIATLQQKRAAVAAIPVLSTDIAGESQQKAELVRIDGEIALLQTQRSAQLMQNTNAEGDAQRKLYSDMIKGEETLLSLEGRKVDAARVKLGLDIQDLDAQLRKAGVPDDQRTSALSAYSAQGSAQIDFGQQLGAAQAGLAQLETQRKAIQDQVTSGETFSIAAAQKLVALDNARLPALQADAQALVALAQLTKDPADVQKAEEYKQKIDQITASTKQLEQQTAMLKQGIENAIGAGFTKFFQDAEKGAKGFKDAFHDMAQAIEQDLLNIANQFITQQILQQLFGVSSTGQTGASSLGGAGGLFGWVASLFGSGSGAAATSSLTSADLVGITGSFAAGGQIRGPGTGTSDSIPLFASDGEYIVNAQAAAQPGVLRMLDAINQGAMGRFADGGLVSTIVTPRAADPNKNGRFMPGFAVTNNFHIQAPHGSISRQTQKQIGARAYKAMARAHQANN